VITAHRDIIFFFFIVFFFSVSTVRRAKAEQVKITLGEYSLNSDVEPLSPVQVGVAEIHVHPYFKFTPQADRYDVAVLRLDRYVPYEPHISPICLPEKGDDFLGEYAWAAGWGAMQAGRLG
jgi:transmembrane protease serine 6